MSGKPPAYRGYYPVNRQAADFISRTWDYSHVLFACAEGLSDPDMGLGAADRKVAFDAIRDIAQRLQDDVKALWGDVAPARWPLSCGIYPGGANDNAAEA